MAIPDPVYLDTNIMAGRAGDFNGDRFSNIVYLDAIRENESRVRGLEVADRGIFVSVLLTVGKMLKKPWIGWPVR